MTITIVSILRRQPGKQDVFIGSGLLLDSQHVLTAAHVWDDAAAERATVVVGMLPGRGTATAARLRARMEHDVDAAILQLIDWVVDVPIEPPPLQGVFVDLKGRRVDMWAVTPLEQAVIRVPGYAVVDHYDTRLHEIESMPAPAQGNSGGVLVCDGRIVGLIVLRIRNEPIARALAMHRVAPWIAGTLSSAPAVDKTRLEHVRTPKPLSATWRVNPPGTPNLSHRLGSIHLHVDGAHATEFIEQLVAQHRSIRYEADFARVASFAPGRQRASMPGTYGLHTPGTADVEELDFFSTTQLHPGPADPDPAERRRVAMVVHDVLTALHDRGAAAVNVVAELERVVGVVERGSDGEPVVHLADSVRLAQRPGVLDMLTESQLFASFNKRDVQRVTEASYELHFSLDVPRSDGDESPPVELEYLRALAERADIELGGWFLFAEAGRWAYRSNAFVGDVSAQGLRLRWSKLRTLLDAERDPALRGARLRLLAEEALGVWKTPFMLAADGLLTVTELANWEQSIGERSTFWVVLPNFLGDQNALVELAMRRNLNRGVRYVYFLRTDADAKRWLDFRRRVLHDLPQAVDLMEAFVVDFAGANDWDRAAAFIANPTKPGAEGYGLRIDKSTNRVLGGARMSEARLAELVGALSPVLAGGKIRYWHTVEIEQQPVTVAAVCVKLVEWPADDEFERIDSQLALLASNTNGAVALYGSKSITVVFTSDRHGPERALQFAHRVVCSQETRSDDAHDEMHPPVPLLVGLDWGEARRVQRACGLMWSGAAVRGCSEVLHGAPRGTHLRLTAPAAQRFRPALAGLGLRVEPAHDGLACWPPQDGSHAPLLSLGGGGTRTALAERRSGSREATGFE